MRGRLARIAGIAALLVGVAAAGACDSERPNIVLFTGDDHSKLDAGCYGNPTIRTPTLDSLAANGLVFDNFFTVTAICCPSRAALMTGQYPFTNGCFGMTACDDGIRPLTAILADAGYHCGLVGKRHLAPWDAFRFEYAPADPKGEKMGRDVTTYTDDVRGFFDHLKTESKPGPFFLMVNFHDPHRVFPTPDEVPQPADRATVVIPPTLPDLPDVREEVGRYTDAVQRMDGGIRLCLAALRQSGLADNTIVIYLSDHGAGFPFAKSTLYDAGTNIPMIMSWPGRIGAGRRTSALASVVDFAPTILEVVGIPIPESMQGESFATVLAGKSDRHRDAVYGSQTDDFVPPSYPIRSARTERFAYLFNVHPDRRMGNNTLGGLTWAAMVKAAESDTALARRVDRYEHRPPEEMYDVASDPFELRNLAADPACAADLAAMRALLVAHMVAAKDPFVALLPFASDGQRAAARAAHDAYLAYDADRTKNFFTRPRGQGRGDAND